MIVISKISANNTSAITFFASIEAATPTPDIKVETYPIVGRYLWHDGRHINLLKIQPLSVMERYVDADMLHALKHIVKYQLPSMKNWGINEQDYRAAFNSHDPKIRGLVAKNGEYLAELSKDTDPAVRLMTVEYLIDNANEIDNINTDYLDVMVKDKDVAIRSMLAKLGIVVFNDILVKDPSVLIRGQVAKHGNDEQRKLLETQKNGYIQSMLC